MHDVNDLLAIPVNFTGPSFNLSSLSRAGDSGGNPLFPEEADEPESEQKTREELLQELVDLIQDVIEPGTWDAGD